MLRRRSERWANQRSGLRRSTAYTLNSCSRSRCSGSGRRPGLPWRSRAGAQRLRPVMTPHSAWSTSVLPVLASTAHSLTRPVGAIVSNSIALPRSAANCRSNAAGSLARWPPSSRTSDPIPPPPPPRPLPAPPVPGPVPLSAAPALVALPVPATGATGSGLGVGSAIFGGREDDRRGLGLAPRGAGLALGFRLGLGGRRRRGRRRDRNVDQLRRRLARRRQVGRVAAHHQQPDHAEMDRGDGGDGLGAVGARG